MNALRIVLLAVAAVLLLATRAAAAGPAHAATDFLHHVQRGDLARAKSLLESPKYRSSPQGGDDAYFSYESGYDPTLAFLVGRPFSIGTPVVREQRSDWYLIDGTMYGYVALPLQFARERYQPWLLPAPLAFGRRMEFVGFMNFVVNPGADADRLSQRLRPSVARGIIAPPAPRVAPPPPPVAPPGAQAVVPRREPGDTYGSLFSPQPVDAAPVVLPSGETLDERQLQRLLPRLQRITLHVSLMRWGRFTSWHVSRWNFTDAVLATEKGDVVVNAGGQQKQ